MYELIIIGAGPMGLFASFYAALRNFKAVTLEITPSYGGQLKNIYPHKPIYDIPGFKEIKASEFIDELYKQYEPYKESNPIIYNEKIISIEEIEGGYNIQTETASYQTKTLLVTSGNGDSKPRKLELENANKCQNILYRVDNPLKYNGNNIVVLGGGDSAVDIANMLAPTNNVTIIHRREEFRAHEESLEKFKKQGTILTPYTIKEIKYTTKCEGLIIEDNKTHLTKEIPSDYVFVSYGMLPSKDVITSYLSCDPLGIIVNQSMETDKKGIYAAGNCVSYIGKCKTLTSGLGEVQTAISAIHQYLYPTKNPTFYSSINKK